MEDISTENTLRAAAELLPTPVHLTDTITGASDIDGLAVIGMPKNFAPHTVDLEKFLTYPRRAKLKGRMLTSESFLAYAKRQADESTVAWCLHDPLNSKLSFRMVLDDHTEKAGEIDGLAGWREHIVDYTPPPSVEWTAWTGADGKLMSQLEFAQWIEDHDRDFTTKEGERYPSATDMLKMATEFVATGEQSVKSMIRLQTGGVRLQYINDNDANTIAQLETFAKFAIAIPVFRGGPSYLMVARLRYHQQAHKPCFKFELQRPDLIHQHASDELIALVRAGLGDVPLFMGSTQD